MDKFFTIAECCDLARVGAKTLRRAYLSGELRAYQRVAAGKVLVRESDLISWIESRPADAAESGLK